MVPITSHPSRLFGEGLLRAFLKRCVHLRLGRQSLLFFVAASATPLCSVTGGEVPNSAGRTLDGHLPPAEPPAGVGPVWSSPSGWPPTRGRTPPRPAAPAGREVRVVDACVRVWAPRRAARVARDWLQNWPFQEHFALFFFFGTHFDPYLNQGGPWVHKGCFFLLKEPPLKRAFRPKGLERGKTNLLTVWVDWPMVQGCQESLFMTKSTHFAIFYMAIFPAIFSMNFSLNLLRWVFFLLNRQP